MALFSCSISPFRVLSANQTMTNAKANWLCFGAFLSPSARLLRLQRSQVTRLPPLATIFPLSARPAGSACADLLPLATACRKPPDCQKPNGARSRRAPPSLYQYVTEPGDSCGKNNPFLLTRRRATVDRSLVATALNATSSRRACRMAISRNACFRLALPDFPEFAQSSTTALDRSY